MEERGRVAPTLPELECDVVVVGMGTAGLVVANRAAELGVDVLIVDKLPDGWWIGGDTIISGQGIHICYHSPMLPEDQLIRLINERTGGKAIPELVNTLIGNCHRSMKWLMDKGIEFEEPPGQEMMIKPRKPVPGPWALIKPGGLYDSSRYGGKKAMETLVSLLEERGVRIMYETKAVRLLMDAGGGVSGVLAKGGDGLFEIRSKATILCTGGFQRNREMLLRYIGPHADEVPVVSGPGATGDGILMALEAGAALRSMNYLGFTIWPEAASSNEDIRYLSVTPVAVEGVVVDRNGERFCDESLGSRMWGSVMAKLSVDIVGLVVVDDVIYEEKVKSLVDSVVDFGGTVYRAGSIEELAEMAGVSPYLVTTVREFNRAVDEGRVDRLRVPRTANVNKIVKPPFRGVPFTLGMISTYGGLLVSSKGEVLDRDMSPIRGLYAAGAVMQGSLSGGVENRYASYVGHLATCLVFGVICAENASELC